MISIGWTKRRNGHTLRRSSSLPVCNSNIVTIDITPAIRLIRIPVELQNERESTKVTLFYHKFVCYLYNVWMLLFWLWNGPFSVYWAYLVELICCRTLILNSRIVLVLLRLYFLKHCISFNQMMIVNCLNDMIYWYGLSADHRRSHVSFRSQINDADIFGISCSPSPAKVWLVSPTCSINVHISNKCKLSMLSTCTTILHKFTKSLSKVTVIKT